MKFAIALHVLSSVIWVGGMFFAYAALRPSALFLDTSLRLQLWSNTLGRFLKFVWIAIVLLLATGYWMIFAVFGGMKGIPLYINLMQGIGVIMMMIAGHVTLAPFKHLKMAVAASDSETGAKQLCQIRRFVGINLAFGIINIIIASSGRYW